MYTIEKETADRIIVRKTAIHPKTGLLIAGSAMWKISVDKNLLTVQTGFKLPTENCKIERIIFDMFNTILEHNNRFGNKIPNYIHVISKFHKVQ